MIIIHGSARENGNTENLSSYLTEGLESEEVFLRKHHILPIVDQRHVSGGFQVVEDDYASVANKMLSHDHIVFTTPVYWYGMSGNLKNFIDRWSQSLREPEIHFAERMKGKKIYVVTVGGDDPKIKALPLIMQFQHIIDFLGATFAGYVIGQGNKPGDVQFDKVAIEKATTINQQIVDGN